jgi:hypothetical protein
MREKELCADQVLTFAVGNNVGISLGESFFASMTYACLVRSEGGLICCDFNNLRR